MLKHKNEYQSILDIHELQWTIAKVSPQLSSDGNEEILLRLIRKIHGEEKN